MSSKGRQHYRHLPAFILLALAENPVHGSAIHTLLMERMGLSRPDSGAIYRTLQQLEQDGEVVFEWDTSGSGPARKVYRLTPAGWEKLAQWREDIEMRLANLQNFLKIYAALNTR
ncbi:PadR family transcriptional regulator [Geomonas sp.]|uniref:PadR family transcriptional regulator n=1 Tax=Geomonas sp. TaxID=2651584 RepID=UPI002B490CD5|nr:helix-turn-helix transcriptional regulator [Geomonas sp.]HJV35327.1 helix-turn-helix transcriptional regulator [Geomonas sp.]